MFGSRKSQACHPGEISISRVHPNLPEDAFELARFWATEEKSFVAVGFQKSWSPELLGSLLIECLHTAADAYAAAHEISQEESLTLLWKGVDAERARLQNPSKEIH